MKQSADVSFGVAQLNVALGLKLTDSQRASAIALAKRHITEGQGWKDAVKMAVGEVDNARSTDPGEQKL